MGRRVRALTARERQIRRYLSHDKLADCDRELRKESGVSSRPEGAVWTCVCGRRFVHVIEESEGSFWVPEED